MLKEKYKYPDDKIESYCPSGSWQTSRYVQIFIDGALRWHQLLYTVLMVDGTEVELHFEGEDWETKYGVFIFDRLMDNTQNCDDLTWSEWGCGYRCQHTWKIEQYRRFVSDDVVYDGTLWETYQGVYKEKPAIESRTILSDMTLPSSSDKAGPAAGTILKRSMARYYGFLWPFRIIRESIVGKRIMSNACLMMCLSILALMIKPRTVWER